MRAAEKLAADIAAGLHYCHVCKDKRVWVEKRGAQHCETCDERFPCRSAQCGHGDCNDARHARKQARKTVAEAQS
jgi:hypothetical protein